MILTVMYVCITNWRDVVNKVAKVFCSPAYLEALVSPVGQLVNTVAVQHLGAPHLEQHEVDHPKEDGWDKHLTFATTTDGNSLQDILIGRPADY